MPAILQVEKQHYGQGAKIVRELVNGNSLYGLYHL
jgi:hypothetical protein